MPSFHNPISSKPKRLLGRSRRLDKTELQGLIDDLSARQELYRKRADYPWFPGVPKTRLSYASGQRRLRHLKRALKTAPLETNQRGNAVERWFRPCSSYMFDTKLREYQRYSTDQDAEWFGVWVDVIQRKVFTYAEGDCILVSCPTVEGFAAELAHMEAFYGPAPAFMRAFNGDGSATHFVETRPGSDLIQSI
ncbi:MULTISPECIES: hypothetical protein [Ralstonia]|jgi:hypothetical protein|uniref:Uncharacterized protein n=2 Tax=Ralstonia pickettii TaxID=329 RepID=R0CM74_RALPI|nr:hypothetical protein [Ralstonia pickettii]ENZ77761.1 hypothetical protein OR214_02037 [Ralstonia pickettii OR214]